MYFQVTFISTSNIASIFKLSIPYYKITISLEIKRDFYPKRSFLVICLETALIVTSDTPVA